jgi:hypothetical protein
MTERTITEQELKNILIMSIGIDYAVFNTVLNKAFPPIFKPKEGEIIWVRYNDRSPWELRIFKYMENSVYCCEEHNHNKKFYWSQVKPQTPTQKGE